MAKVNPTFRLLCRKPNLLLAFGFGSGLSPVMPGTVGTLAAIPLYYVLQHLAPLGYTLAVVLACLAGVFICGRAARALGEHDHSGIVWDEFVGYWITMAFVPLNWLWIAVGFALFRFFDIVKPWPITWVDKKVHGGMGIMLDDILAGVAAALVLQLIISFVG